jgi:hypothetical protein
MGLSNEERTSNIYEVIRQIKDCLDTTGIKIPSHQRADFKAIRKEADKLWYAFIGHHRHSGFWIFGGDASNDVVAPNGPWSAAILRNISDSRNEDSCREYDPVFDGLSVSSLIAQDREGRVCKIVYDVFALSESLSYALRRYDDDFLRELSRLDKVVADLQGACYGFFRKSEAFTKAYVLHRIVAALYGVDQNDPVRTFFVEEHIHHDLSRPMVDSDLAEIMEWDAWRLQREMTPENRLVLALRIAGRRFHYEHKFKDMVRRLDGFDPKPRLEVLEAEFAACCEAHKQYEASPGPQEDQKVSARVAIHGQEAYSWESKPSS